MRATSLGQGDEPRRNDGANRVAVLSRSGSHHPHAFEITYVYITFACLYLRVYI